MTLPQYRNFPFGAGNARNGWFWGVLLVVIIFALISLAKRSRYDIISGRTGNGITYHLTGDQKGDNAVLNLRLGRMGKKMETGKMIEKVSPVNTKEVMKM
jgi:hypothetical protein